MKRPRLTTVKPRLQSAPGRQVQQLPTPSERRITGRKLQDRRLKVWAKDPHCAQCGKLCEFPNGFELDHRVPLFQGGDDTEANCQVLCSGPDGCHASKTAAERV